MMSASLCGAAPHPEHRRALELLASDRMAPLRNFSCSSIGSIAT